MSFDFASVKFEEVTCLICKSNDHIEKLFIAKDLLCGLPGEFNVVKCLGCGLVFQNPRPQEQFIGNYYPDDLGYFNTQNENGGISFLSKKILTNFYAYTNLGKKKIVEKILLFPLYIYLYKHRSIPQYRKNGTLLEIGCSDGLALKKLQELSWQTKGIEMNSKAARYARDSRDLDVESGAVSNFKFKPESFDVIILDMVLEHLYNPDKTMKEIISWLKKDGELIFSIPYFGGLEFKVFKQYSYGLQLPTHITFFNKNSLYHILKGFQKIHFSFHHFDRDVVASAQYRYDARGSILDKFIATNKLFRILIIKPSVFILSLLGKTSRVTVFARKQS